MRHAAPCAMKCCQAQRAKWQAQKAADAQGAQGAEGAQEAPVTHRDTEIILSNRDDFPNIKSVKSISQTRISVQIVR
jgi:hypothetical protein